MLLVQSKPDMTPLPQYSSHGSSSMVSLDIPLPPVDGCVLLGKDDTATTCDFATRYHVMDRMAQRHEVINHVVMEEVVPCCAPKGCALKERMWGVLRSEILLISVHITVLIIGYLKAFVHTIETHHELHLIHAVVETVLTCKILIIRAFIVKEKFHEIKDVRLSLEYVPVSDDTPSISMKVWSFAYFTCTLIMCGVVIGVFVVCFKHAHLGWISLPNNVMIVLAVFTARLTMFRYELMMKKVQYDHLLICLLEAKTLLSEQLCAIATDQTKETHDKIEHFLRGLNKTPEFDKPFYIASLDDLPRHVSADHLEIVEFY